MSYLSALEAKLILLSAIKIRRYLTEGYFIVLCVM